MHKDLVNYNTTAHCSVLLLFFTDFGCKSDGYSAAAEGGFETFYVCDVADGGIAVGSCESLVEDHHAVVAIEHNVACVDGINFSAVGGERLGEVVVFLVVVQFLHLQRQGQKGSEGFGGAVLLHLSSETPVTDGERNVTHGGRRGCEGLVFRCASRSKE